MVNYLKDQTKQAKENYKHYKLSNTSLKTVDTFIIFTEVGILSSSL